MKVYSFWSNKDRSISKLVEGIQKPKCFDGSDDELFTKMLVSFDAEDDIDADNKLMFEILKLGG